MANPKIKQITLPSGNTYDLWDEDAHRLIYELESPGEYLGVTTSTITDGSSTNPIIIDGQSVTAGAGDWCITSSDKKAYIFSGTTNKWQEFTDMTNLGSLAYKDSASGTVAVPTSASSSFSGTATTLKITPAGSVSLTNSNKTATVSQDSSAGATATYTPAGTVSQPTFSGSATTSTGKFTPSGSVSTPTISLNTAGDTTTIKNPTAKTVVTDMSVAAPAAAAATGELIYYEVANECLTFKKIVETNGDSITTTNTTVKTSDATYSASQPTFTGTEGNISVSGTPSGTVSQPTFSGTGARLVTGNIAVPTSASFSGTEGSISYTPAGNVSTSLSDTNKTVTVS